MNNTLQHYSVWDRTTRWFHWINALTVLSLLFIGLLILNGKTFGLSSSGKVLLKTIHAYFGYFFVINLVWRIIWGVIGGHYSRWQQILPFGRGYITACRQYLLGSFNQSAPSYKGHNPIARLMVSIMFLALITQAATGLVIVSTDLFYPPFGNAIAKWVTDSEAKNNNNHELITPLNKRKYIVKKYYKEMRAFRRPYILTHIVCFYVLCVLIVLHIAAVVVTEIREKNGIISALFTGKKVFSNDNKPID